jgi:hypothetical protein
MFDPRESAKEWRKRLGFTSQSQCRDFLSGKTVAPGIDEEYLQALHNHLGKMVHGLHTAVHPTISIPNGDVAGFLRSNRDEVLNQLRNNHLLARLNNQGRRPEEVYFSWMRGHLVVRFFHGAIRALFGSLGAELHAIGGDDFSQPATFRRSATADLGVIGADGKTIARLEIQSGFTGINDLKRHKVVEARNIHEEEGIRTYLVDFDLFNGMVAVLDLCEFTVDDDRWVQRQQMEGQWVLPLDFNWFAWRLLDPAPTDFRVLLPD